MIRSAAAGSSRCCSISTADSSSAAGFARFLPAMSGALPWTASKTRNVGAEIGRADDTKASHESGAQVRYDVAVQIRQQQHVELGRVHDEVHAGCVHDPLVVRDVDVLPRDAPGALEKEPVALFHDVRLVNRRHAPATVTARVAERKLCDPCRRALGDDFQAFNDAGHDRVLEAGVQVLGIFADDDEIDPFEAGRHAGQVRNGPQVGVQVECFSKADVDAREPGRRSASSPVLSAPPCSVAPSRSVRPAASAPSARKRARPRDAGPSSITTPDALRIRTTASVTSGPMPSPGIKVMVWVISSATLSGSRQPRPPHSRAYHASKAPPSAALASVVGFEVPRSAATVVTPSIARTRATRRMNA